MLSPDYLEYIADALLELYETLNISIVRDIARRLVKTGAITDGARHQTLRAQEAGALYEDIIKEIGKITGKSEVEIKRIFTDAAVESLRYDDEIYKAAGLNPLPLKQSPALLHQLLAGMRKTNRLVNNLTLTTANTSQTVYINACNLAYMQVNSGAFDYITAIRNAIKSAAQAGTTVLYPTGHSDKLDVAIRRSVLTGVGQTCGVLGEMRAEDMGCDLMEITAHAGARPSHAVWQGKIVSLSGRKGYLSKNDIGYGTGNGFKGWNCRHDWYPFFEGISTPAYNTHELQKLDEPVFEYEDKQYTTYEGTQVQRELERRIRATKRELAGLDEAIKGTDDEALKAGLKEGFSSASVKLKAQEKKMREFLDASGMLEDKARTQVLGFGRSQASKAVQAKKKDVERVNYLTNIKPTQEKTSIAANTSLQDTLLFQIALKGKIIEGVVPKQASLEGVRIIAGFGTSSDIRVAKDLADKYGGDYWKWQKKGGIIKSAYKLYDVHWYEYNDKQYEVKLKGVKDK